MPSIQEFRTQDTMEGGLRIDAPSSLIVRNRVDFKNFVRGKLAEGVHNFWIDFANTNYIDSSGLGALIKCHGHINKVGGNLYLMNVNEDILTLFDTTQVTSMFQIVDDPTKKAPAQHT